MGTVVVTNVVQCILSVESASLVLRWCCLCNESNYSKYYIIKQCAPGSRPWAEFGTSCFRLPGEQPTSSPGSCRKCLCLPPIVLPASPFQVLPQQDLCPDFWADAFLPGKPLPTAAPNLETAAVQYCSFIVKWMLWSWVWEGVACPRPVHEFPCSNSAMKFWFATRSLCYTSSQQTLDSTMDSLAVADQNYCKLSWLPGIQNYVVFLRSVVHCIAV